MKCCGGSGLSTGRTWWVSDISWTTDSLLLIGITRNGALFITSKLGEPVKLVTTGHGMNLGPSLFLSLHPRITVKSFQENIPPENSEISSGSEKDIFHQKFSVCVHPSQPLMLCSDGYMVTIFDLNSKPDYSELITKLTKDATRFLSSDSTLHESENTTLEKSVTDVTAASTFMAKYGKDVGEHSSPGSTLSETATGFGIVQDIEAGVITFGDTEDNKCSFLNVEEMSVKQKIMKAESIILQGFGIGTSCGIHWSANMHVALNLLIHTWVKLLTILLEDESHCGLANNDALLHNIASFVQSCFEAFRWDVIYQHCLPWLTQFVHSTIKCLVSSNKFDFQDIIDLCKTILRMAEVFLREIYSWAAAGNCTSSHFLGDNYSPSFDKCSEPCSHYGGPTIEKCVNHDCKLDQSWLTLYHYVCKKYKSNLKTGVRKTHTSDERLLQILCWIQRKLQAMNSSRNLTLPISLESLSDQGYKMYLDGNYKQAVDLLERSFHENNKEICLSEVKDFVTSSSLELNQPDSLGRRRLSSFGASLIEEDLFSKLSADIETLLTILYINLENYDLKAALGLVYSFIDTTRDVNLRDILNTTYEGNQALITVDDTEVKVTSSSSLKMVQMSVLVKYPLAWITDNRGIPVVQQLARFMTCYFTNLPLVIPKPFRSQTTTTCFNESCEDVIPSTHTSTIKNLSQQRLTEVISQQKLEHLWTADHTMEMLLVSGLLGEAAWFANCLGDWKIAFLLSVTEQFRMRNERYVKKSYDHAKMAIEVPEPKRLMKERIHTILKLDGNFMEGDVVDGTREIFDDEGISNLRNLLEASVITELNLVPEIIKQLIVILRKIISKLDWMVPQDLYLPAPPLYCPQPARNDGDVLSEETRKEISLRSEIAIIVQKILAMYRASSCFLHCAQEYCKHVVRNRSDDHAEALPTIIKEIISTNSVYIDTRDYENLDSEVTRSFQEFCILMWLLDVRNELALSSRKYSKVKQNLSPVSKDEERQEVFKHCTDVLVWLQKLLPFSNFLDADADVLDGILTLLSESPLTYETVDILAQHFHTPDPAMTIPTTDKLNRMTRKIRNYDEEFEKGESLTVRFQKQCKKQRKEKKNVPVQLENQFLEVLPDFCENLDFQHDFAFLRFLDTFLLITLAKNVTSEDYKKVPLILPYKDMPVLEADLSSVETMARRKVKAPGKSSLRIQRSESFHDVGNIKKRTESGLFSSDDHDLNKHTPLKRTNSLIDLRRIQISSFSEELQAFLPKLLWLKRWCLIDETQKGNPAVNRSYSFLNTTTSPTAIRVQLPLKLVVNTLWLFENYYNDFAKAKGKCVRGKPSRVKKKKRSFKKGVPPLNMRKDDPVEGESKQDGEVLPETAVEVEKGKAELQGFVSSKGADDPSLFAAVSQEDNMEEAGKSFEKSEVQGLEAKSKKHAKMDEQNLLNVESFSERGSQDCDTVRRRRKRGTKNQEMRKHEVEKSLTQEKFVDSTDETMGVKTNGQLSATERKKERQRKGIRNISVILDHDEAGRSDSQGNTNITEEQADCRHNRPLKKIHAPILNQTEGEMRGIASMSGVRNKNFSPTSSSLGSKWKSFGSIDGDMPLFSFTSQDDSKIVNGKKYGSLSEMVSASDVNEAGVVGAYPRIFSVDDMSLSSESLSVGQIRNNVAVKMKLAANMNSDSSVTTASNYKQTRHRKTTKRKVQKESSSCDSAEQPRVKPVDEGDLLRRIIRSEMRKFIKAQQAEHRSQSSTINTTEENSSASIYKDELHRTNNTRKSRFNRKIRQEPSTSSGKNRGKTKKDPVYASSQQQYRDSQTSSAPVYKQATSDQGKIYQPSTDEGKTSHHKSSTNHHDTVENSPRPPDINELKLSEATAFVPNTCPSNDNSGILNAAAPNQTQESAHYPFQVFPPIVSDVQFPSATGWPIWYNPTLPPPPWLWSNAAPRVNSDKGTQVEKIEQDHVTENTRTKPSVVEVPLTNQAVDSHDNIKDKIVSVAVQTTDIVDKKEETLIKRDISSEEPTPNNVPFLLSLKDQVDASNEDHEMKEPDTANYILPPQKAQASNTGDDHEKHNVFTKDLSDVEYSNDTRDPKMNIAPTNDDPFTIPLLKFPTEVHSHTPDSLPFKIAWPEHADPQRVPDRELPLLQLSNNEQTQDPAEYLSFPEQEPMIRHFENTPFLHFSRRDNEDRNFDDFRLVQVPENDDFQFPLLYLPETDMVPPNLYPEFESRYAGDPEKDKSGRNKGISDNDELVGERSKARVKRRNQLYMNVTARPTGAPFSKKTSRDGPFEEAAGDATHVTVQSNDEKSASRNGKSKKMKPRRRKLKELNDIIRDLQRDVTNDDDLIVSEVSSILSPGVRYENFETKPSKNYNEPGSTKKIPTMMSHKDERTHRGSNVTSTASSRLHRPSQVSARDIHTEIPSYIPEPSIAIDAKVGTENVLRFPVSVQTDTMVDVARETFSSPRHETTEPIVETRKPRVQTRELSIQTEKEYKNMPARIDTCDVAINTDNIQKHESKAATSLFPRVPTDVYLDIQDIDQKQSEITSSSKDADRENGPRMFLSVVDVTEEDVRRQTQDKKEAIVEEKEDIDYRKNENTPNVEGIKNYSPVSPTSQTSEKILVNDIEKGDGTTVAVFSPKDFQSSRLNQQTSRGNTPNQAQRISKGKLSLQLQEMNEQFDAIEELTQNMEQDLQRSNRLLRTIENLNRVTDHAPKVDKWKRDVDENVEGGTRKQTRNAAKVNTRMAMFPETENTNYHGELTDENEMSQKSSHVQYEHKKSVLNTRPWVNKPMEELTNFAPDDRNGKLQERSVDSLENSREKTPIKTNAANMSDASDETSSSKTDFTDTKLNGDSEEYKDKREGIQSRRSSESSRPINISESRVKKSELSETIGADTFKLSLTPEDVLNISREKLTEILMGTATPTVAKTRSRDKTPQKQEELREWMARRRKLRHKEWSQKLDEKRETEFKPFQSKIQKEKVQLSSKKLKKCEKERQDNRRTQKKEHVDERLLSAYDLMNEMVAEHAPKRAPLITQNSVTNSQRKTGKKTTRVKANNRYKENRNLDRKKGRKKPTEKANWKSTRELSNTRTIPSQAGLTRLNSSVNTELSVQNSDLPEVYHQYTGVDHSLDPRVDELLEDVSLGDPLDFQRLDNIDSLLSGDSELRDLLNDVIENKQSRRSLLETDGNRRNSMEGRWRDSSPFDEKRIMLDTFKVDRMEKAKDSHEKHPDILSVNEEDNLEMSDEVAALLAEAKAAIGDDFSGTSEVGDIDWNEVDAVLEQNN
ncbi:uncharacterized protein LOC114518472 [Dendronephthya gigantea]|uniref:uncharacterized protein LOC114518472 n=1 Tax=Dendronephthya gigantea TaxID=151771 RepID=UPI00106C0C08|nr:uncharacterized protein LOC114518472 [Dendronephthya gigantea]